MNSPYWPLSASDGLSSLVEGASFAITDPKSPKKEMLMGYSGSDRSVAKNQEGHKR